MTNTQQGPHQMTVIGAHHAGFGMYEAGEYNGDTYNDVYDYADALNDAGAEWYADGDSEAPAEAQAAINAVKGNCYNEPDLLIAVRVEEGWQIEGVSWVEA